MNDKLSVYLVQPNYKGGYGKYSSFWFPYSVGSIWAYAIQDPTITANYNLEGLLYQRSDIGEVIAGIKNPKIVGFSNYIWNINYNRALASAIKKQWPETLIVFGGPEVPDRMDGFFESHPYVDITVHQEGEVTFARILSDYLRDTFDPADIPGISYRHPRDGMVKNPSSKRIQDLEMLPSPYLSGVFDELIQLENIQWAATFETNRGCPFKCHFCDWGSLTFSKVRKHSENRALRELEWFGDHRVEYIFIADANFGAFKKRDYAIADHMIDVRNRTGYPKNVNIQWAKNSNEDIVHLASRLGSVQKGMTLSVQSMSDDVLEAIERKNMAIHNLSDILTACEKAAIPSYTELILGLPLETFESWQNGWHKLLDLGQHCSIEVWIAQLLENSAMNHPDEKSKYGIEAIKVKNYFFGIAETADQAETAIDEGIFLVRATNTMPFEDLVEAYMYSWMMINFHLFGLTQLVSRFLNRHSNIPFGEFYHSLFEFVRLSESGSIVGDQYRFIKRSFEQYLTEGDIEINLKDYIGLDMKFVGHNLIYASQMVFRYHQQAVYNEIKPFLLAKTGSLDTQLQEDLLKAHESSLLKFGVKYPQSFELYSNIVEYIFADAELKSGCYSYSAQYSRELSESVPGFSELGIHDFLNVLWFRRRLGPGVMTLRPKKNQTKPTNLNVVSR